MNVKSMFDVTEIVLVIDWPTKEVPETLALAGFHVVVHGGPGPEDYSEYEAKQGSVVSHHTGRPPEQADLIYSYRPLSELPGIVATAQRLHAKTIWTQSGWSAPGVRDPKGCWMDGKALDSARKLVEAAGLNFVSEPYIGEAAREFRRSQQRS